MLHWRAIFFSGIDYHREYSVLRTLDAGGTRVKKAWIDHQQPEAIAAHSKSQPKVSRAAMAAWRN